MFALKIFKVEYYQGRPLKEFDVTYSQFRGAEVKNVPVIRIFGTTPSGQKACVHVHGVLPYLSVPYDGPLSEVALYSQRLAFAIDKALNIARAHSASTTQHVHDIRLLSAIPFYGFHKEKRHFLRIYFYNPTNVKRVAELLLSGAIMSTVLQPHEAHVPYILQFFIDHNLAGMELLTLAHYKFRGGGGGGPQPPHSQKTGCATPEAGVLFWDPDLLDSEMLVSYERQTTCELELDCNVGDFTARLEDPEYHGMNPGLANIWEDEKCRRRARQDDSQLTPPVSQERESERTRLNEDCHLWHKWQTLQKTLQKSGPLDGPAPASPCSSSSSTPQSICSSQAPIVDESQLQTVVSSSQLFNTQSSQDRSLLEAVLEMVGGEHQDEEDETPPPADDEDRTTAEMSLCIWYQDDQTGVSSVPPPPPSRPYSIPQLDGSQDEPLAPSPGKPKHIHLPDQNKAATEAEASNSLKRPLVRTKASRKMFPPLPLVSISPKNSRASSSKVSGNNQGPLKPKRKSKRVPQNKKPGAEAKSSHSQDPVPGRLSPPPAEAGPAATSPIPRSKAGSSHIISKARKYKSLRLSLTGKRQLLSDKKKKLLEKCPKGLILPPSLSNGDLDKLGKEVITIDRTARHPEAQPLLLGKPPSSPGLKMRFKLTKSSKGTNFQAQLLEEQPASNHSSCNNDSDQHSPQVSHDQAIDLVPPPSHISSSPPLPSSTPCSPSPSSYHTDLITAPEIPSFSSSLPPNPPSDSLRSPNPLPFPSSSPSKIPSNFSPPPKPPSYSSYLSPNPPPFPYTPPKAPSNYSPPPKPPSYSSYLSPNPPPFPSSPPSKAPSNSSPPKPPSYSSYLSPNPPPICSSPSPKPLPFPSSPPSKAPLNTSPSSNPPPYSSYLSPNPPPFSSSPPPNSPAFYFSPPPNPQNSSFTPPSNSPPISSSPPPNSLQTSSSTHPLPSSPNPPPLPSSEQSFQSNNCEVSNEEIKQDISVIQANQLDEPTSPDASGIASIVDSSQSMASPRTTAFSSQDLTPQQSCCSIALPSSENQSSTIVDFSEILNHEAAETQTNNTNQIIKEEKSSCNEAMVMLDIVSSDNVEDRKRKVQKAENVLPPAKKLKTFKESRRGPKKRSKLAYRSTDSLIANDGPDASDNLKDVLWKLSLYSPVKQTDKSYISTLDPQSPTQLIPTPPRNRPKHIYLPKFAKPEQCTAEQSELPVPVYEAISPPNSPERPSENYQCNLFKSVEAPADEVKPEADAAIQEMVQDKPKVDEVEEEENTFEMLSQLNLMLSDIEKEAMKPNEEVQNEDPKPALPTQDDLVANSGPGSMQPNDLASLPIAQSSKDRSQAASSQVDRNTKSDLPESPILFDDSLFEFSKESFCDNQEFFGASQFSAILPNEATTSGKPAAAAHSSFPTSPISVEGKGKVFSEGSSYIDMIFSDDQLCLSNSNTAETLSFDTDNLSIGFSQNKEDEGSNSSLHIPSSASQCEKPKDPEISLDADSTLVKDELSLTLENEIKKWMSPSHYSKSLDIFEGDSLFSLNKEDGPINQEEENNTLEAKGNEDSSLPSNEKNDKVVKDNQLPSTSFMPDHILTPDSQASGTSSIYSFYNYSTFNEGVGTPLLIDSDHEEHVPSPQSQSSKGSQHKLATPSDSTIIPSRKMPTSGQTSPVSMPNALPETPMIQHLNKIIQETPSSCMEYAFHSTPLTTRKSYKRKSKRRSQRANKRKSSLAIIPEISPILPDHVDPSKDGLTKRSLHFQSPVTPKEKTAVPPVLKSDPLPSCKDKINTTTSSLKLVEPRDPSSHYLTVLSLEVHVATQRNLRPNPSQDSVLALLYSVYHREQWHHGLVVVDFPPGDLSSQDSSLHRSLQAAAASRTPLPSTYVPDETALIQELANIVLRYDPELLCGYEVQGASWGYVLQRAVALGLDLAHMLSRVPNAEDRATHIETDEDQYGADHSSELHIAGRVMLNVWRLMKKEVALNYYTFENVLYLVLHRRVPFYSHRQLTDWYHNPSLRWRVVDYYQKRCQATIKLLLHFDILGRTSELARVFGIQFHEVLTRGSQFRVESMMLRCTRLSDMVAVSPGHMQRAAMLGPEIIPLVMEPSPPGYYHDPVVVLDFQSLYPSIIIAHNYCFSTCLGRLDSLLQPQRADSIKFGCCCLNVPPLLLKELENRVTISPNGVVFVKSSVRAGVLPQLVEDILNTRIMVKTAMKDYKDQKAIYRMLDSRQLALKLIANVTYGYTAANFSGRMPLVELGDSIVGKARQTLERAIKFVNSMHKWKAKVVYGDTDSLFVHLPGRTREEAFRIGQQIADAVTSQNPRPVKLKFEKVYQPCILQTKKHYAGFKYETPDQTEPEFESKGIETIRRDSCPAASKILGKALNLLFSTAGDVAQVKSLVQNYLMRLPSASLQDFVFAKEYRGQAGYRPGSCVPSLEIARRRLRVDPWSEPRTKERVPYVIVYGAPGLPLIQLVREPQELLEDPSLRLNLQYYVSRVILPPLQRAFQLMGHNVNSWYQEIPPVKLRAKPPVQASVRGPQVTLSQWCRVSQCPLCEQRTTAAQHGTPGLCDQCRSSPHTSVLALVAQISAAEKSQHQLTQICQRCTAQRGEIGCQSMACPVFYRRNRLALESQHLPQCYTLLDSWPPSR